MRNYNMKVLNYVTYIHEDWDCKNRNNCPVN